MVEVREEEKGGGGETGGEEERDRRRFVAVVRVGSSVYGGSGVETRELTPVENAVDSGAETELGFEGNREKE